MMRKLFFVGTGLFWLAVFVLALGAWQMPPAPAAPVPLQNSTQRLSLAEVARHARAEDCWMAIYGTVYDLTVYLPEHPSKPSIILPWCGKDATEAYQTKTRVRAHSPQADQELAIFAIGLVE
jgi:cytochrome b involved in lipid metabolism